MIKSKEKLEYLVSFVTFKVSLSLSWFFVMESGSRNSSFKAKEDSIVFA